MNLSIQDYGAIADVIAVMAVVISIFYVSFQIKQNALSTQVSSRLIVTRQNYDFAEMLLREPELSRLWREGRFDISRLSSDEYWRFTMICQQAFWSFSSQFKQYAAGIIDAEDWRESEQLILWCLRGRGIRHWWNHGGRAGSNSTFAEYIDYQLKDKILAQQTSQPTPAGDSEQNSPNIA